MPKQLPKHWLFKTLKSDRGIAFKNEFLEEVCKLLEFNQKFSAPYHQQTIGSLERNHTVFNEYLLNFVNDYEWNKRMHITHSLTIQRHMLILTTLHTS